MNAVSNRELATVRHLVLFEAIGRTYMADGWSPSGPLFTFWVPQLDIKRAPEYAKAWRKHGGGCALAHGDEAVDYVKRIPDPFDRKPRNSERARKLDRLPIFLPPAPDRSQWKLINALYDHVVVERIGESAKKKVTWSELREAAKEDRWYKHLLIHAQSVALC